MKEIKQSDPDFRFQVGDECKYRGHPGNIIRRELFKNVERVWFGFADDFAGTTFYGWFELNGNELDCAWQSEPSLIFVSRPKKKVKKTVEIWLVMNDMATIFYESCRVFKSEKDASDWLLKWKWMYSNERIVKFTAEVEVEEDAQ